MNPWHVSVLIPARNEEQLLRRCLRSVRKALSVLPLEVTSDLIVAVDRSTDRTWHIATEELAGVGAVVYSHAGVVGKARATAADLALTRCRGPHDRCWLANTDADCIVPPNWLTDQLWHAVNGAGAIAGTVDIDSFEEHLPVVKQRFRDTYLIRPDGTHPHVHGANLGFRADLYLRAGGWDHLPTGEDHDLWSRLSTIGARTLSRSQIQVITSGRRVGRAPHGFADALAAHNETVA